MASRFYGVGVGGQAAADVTIDTSTTSSAVELVVVDTNIAAAGSDSKQVILEAIEAIRLAVLQDNY